MDKALVFGTKDCRLESCQDQSKPERALSLAAVECFVAKKT